MAGLAWVAAGAVGEGERPAEGEGEAGVEWVGLNCACVREGEARGELVSFDCGEGEEDCFEEG